MLELAERLAQHDLLDDRDLLPPISRVIEPEFGLAARRRGMGEHLERRRDHGRRRNRRKGLAGLLSIPAPKLARRWRPPASSAASHRRRRASQPFRKNGWNRMRLYIGGVQRSISAVEIESSMPAVPRPVRELRPPGASTLLGAAGGMASPPPPVPRGQTRRGPRNALGNSAWCGRWLRLAAIRPADRARRADRHVAATLAIPYGFKLIIDRGFGAGGGRLDIGQLVPLSADDRGRARRSRPRCASISSPGSASASSPTSASRCSATCCAWRRASSRKTARPKSPRG
jgi:hypothetical protein